MLRNIVVFGIISLFLSANTVLCNDVDIEKLKSQLPEGIIPQGFNTSSLPTQDDAKKLFKEKCEKASNGTEAFVKAENATEVFKECLMNLIDFEALQKEIDVAQPNGDLDTVFNKYCRKRTTAFDCMKDFTVAVEPCLSEQENSSKQIFVNIFTNLLNFVCHKDGDQIALFIAERGPECFNDKKDAITKCVNATMSGYIPSETPTIDSLPQLIMGEKQCADMNTLQHCIVKELESCEESTPANLVESLFKFVRNETPCANMTATDKNAAIIQRTSWTIVSTALLTLLCSLENCVMTEVESCEKSNTDFLKSAFQFLQAELCDRK
ncbi:27 kDa hemolymph protein, partial [Pseudolycoriella hygida]